MTDITKILTWAYTVEIERSSLDWYYVSSTQNFDDAIKTMKKYAEVGKRVRLTMERL